MLVNIPAQDESGLRSPCCSAIDQHHHSQRCWTLCFSPSIQSKFRPQDSLVSFVHTDHMGTCWWPRDCIDRRTEMEARYEFTKKLNSTLAFNTGMKDYILYQRKSTFSALKKFRVLISLSDTVSSEYIKCTLSELYWIFKFMKLNNNKSNLNSTENATMNPQRTCVYYKFSSTNVSRKAVWLQFFHRSARFMTQIPALYYSASFPSPVMLCKRPLQFPSEHIPNIEGPISWTSSHIVTVRAMRSEKVQKAENNFQVSNLWAHIIPPPTS